MALNERFGGVHAVEKMLRQFVDGNEVALSTTITLDTPVGRSSDDADDGLAHTSHNGGDAYVVQLAGGSAKVSGLTRFRDTVDLDRIVYRSIAECRLLPFDQYSLR